MMKALKILEKGKVDFFDIAKPDVKECEVLVKVIKLGYCGSDLNTYRGLNPIVKYPRIPGHEIGGIIEEKGADVPEEIKVGAHVSVIPFTACGKCTPCRIGRSYACKHNETLGVQRDGALTKYIAVPWQKVLVDNALSFSQLAMIEPMAIGFHAAKRARVTKEDKVAVLGCGMIGLGTIAGANLMGGEVIAVDLVDEKLNIARNEAGAVHSINSSKENLHERLQDLTDGHGPDVIIEAAGSAITFKIAVQEVAFAGRVVYIGYTKEPVCYETKYFVMKELDILGSRNSEREDFEHVRQAIVSGKVNPEKFISHTFPFDQADAGLKLWDDDPASVTKIVIEN
jgi:2-desacetyl-2-hydroxyethyl bacteriochlorophyllide A dehydrogenase